LKTGVILAVKQSLGTNPVDIDCVKIIWSMGAISGAWCFNTIDGIPSGLGDLLGSNSQSSSKIL